MSGLSYVAAGESWHDNSAVSDNSSDQVDAKKELRMMGAFVLGAAAFVTFSANVLNVYQHISAESLPKGFVSKSVLQKRPGDINVKVANQNLGMNPWEIFYDKDEVHNGDYYVSEVVSGPNVMRSIQPARAGMNTSAKYYYVKDAPNYKYSSKDDGMVNFNYYLVHTKEHNIINKHALFYSMDSLSILALIGIMSGNSYYMKRKSEVNVI